MGPDGHTASLFPDRAALASPTPARLVVANRDPLGHNPHDRMTLTFPAITRARLVVFTVAGAAKREAFAPGRWPVTTCRRPGSRPTKSSGWSTRAAGARLSLTSGTGRCPEHIRVAHAGSVGRP